MKRFIIGGIAVASTLASGAADAQDRWFPAFRLDRLQQVDTSNGQSDRRFTSHVFDRTRSGRVVSKNIVQCANRNVPPLFDFGREGMALISITYDPTPQSGSFRCLSDDGVPQEIEYRSSVKVDGDLFRFSSRFTTAHFRGETKVREIYDEELAVRFYGDGCEIASYRYVQEYLRQGNSGNRKRMQVVSADGNSHCRLFSRRERR